MSMLENIPAVRQVGTDRTDLVAFDIVGHISSADFENLFGLMEAAYALHSTVDVMIRFVDNDGADKDEIDPRTKEDGKASAALHVRRCAIVGTPDILANSSAMFMARGAAESKEFIADEEAEAWTWLGGSLKSA